MNRPLLTVLANFTARRSSLNGCALSRLNEPVANTLDVCRDERVRPRLAVLALAGLLLGQTLAPCGILLSSVHAEELRAKHRKSAVQPSKAAVPAWVADIEKRALSQQRDQKLRLAQLVRPSKGDKVGESEDSECLDCEVDLKPLDLSDVPTEKALRRAGAGDGPLFPMRRGDAEELGIKLDRLLKRWDIEGGLRGELLPKDPRYKALKRGQERYERARAINMLFGRAVKKWRGDERAQAVELFGQYMNKYPRSPWSGEAALHLGYAAKNGGRLLDASSMFQEVLEKTSDKPNKKLRKQKRERRARGVEVTDVEREADVDKALASGASFEEAVEKLDSAQESDDDDESFEIHMKAKQQLADIAMAMGHYNDASEKLSEIMEEDTNWHRRVWARTQLQRTNVLKQNSGLQLSCGPQALGTMMVGLHKSAAAKKVKAAVASYARESSMAELQTLAAKNGVQTRGFRADIEQLGELSLPAILHYDFGRDFKAKGKSTGHFVVLQGVDEKGEMVRVFDPLNKRALRLSYVQLARQWSGKGLEVTGKNVRLVGTSLDAQAMKGAVGSSTTFGADHDMGTTSNNVDVGVSNGTDGPAVQVNQASFNVYAQQTLMSYQPARGPAINITLSYNSDAGSGYGGPLPMGEKWMFNYASRATTADILDPGNSGQTVRALEIQMPDGSKKLYWTHWENNALNTVLTGMPRDLNYVEVLSTYSCNLVFPDGTKWLYQALPRYNDLYLTQMTEPSGQYIRMNYEQYYSGGSHRRLLSLESSAGDTFNVSYSGDKISAIRDPAGRESRFNYDWNSMLSSVTDQGGRSFSYEYDGLRDLSVIRLPDVNYTPNQTAQTWLINREHPDSNRPSSTRVTVTNPLGDKEGFSYEASNNLWFHVTPNRYTTPYNHFSSWQTHSNYGINIDGESIPLRIRYDDGTDTNYKYEPDRGNVSEIFDRQGQRTQFFYNPWGQLNKVIDPKNVATSTEYAANGFDPVRIIRPNPSGTANVVAQTIAYNDARFPHFPTSVTDVGGTTTYSYNNFGSLLETTDPQQRVSRNVYDANGRLTAIENSDRPVNGPFNWVRAASFAYDNKGRVSEVTAADGLKTSYEYNDLDNVTAIIYPDPDPTKRREEIFYINGDLPVRVKDRFGRNTYTQIDELRRVRKSFVQDPQNGVWLGTTQIDYDKNSNPTQLTDTNGNVTRWSYDTLDRAISKRYQDGTTETSVYGSGTFPQFNGRGRLVQTTGTRGQNIKYEYDNNGNRTKIDYPNTADVTMSYNALNDVAVVSDAIGVTALRYDDYGRLVSNDGPFPDDTQTYSYDELQRVQTQTLQRGASGGVQSQIYAYDALGRLASLNSNGTQGTGLTTYSYDGNTDRLRVLTHPNGTKSDLRYDAMGRLQHVFNGANGDALYNRYSSIYDARDVKINTQWRTDNSKPIATTQYSYDALDQLKQERVTGGVAGMAYTSNYNYDAMGNRTQVDRTSFAANGSSSVATTTSAPNALNQLSSLTTTFSNAPTTSAGLTYDAAGNLTQSLNNDGTRTVYFYDDADRLNRIERRNANNQATQYSVFAYDYASRRVACSRRTSP